MTWTAFTNENINNLKAWAIIFILSCVHISSCKAKLKIETIKKSRPQESEFTTVVDVDPNAKTAIEAKISSGVVTVTFEKNTFAGPVTIKIESIEKLENTDQQKTILAFEIEILDADYNQVASSAILKPFEISIETPKDLITDSKEIFILIKSDQGDIVLSNSQLKVTTTESAIVFTFEYNSSKLSNYLVESVENLVKTDGNPSDDPQPSTQTQLSVETTITSRPNQAAYTASLPISFDVKFSQPINGDTLTVSDFIQTGDAEGISWSLDKSVQANTYVLTATAVEKDGSLNPQLVAKSVVSTLGNIFPAQAVSASTSVILDRTAPNNASQLRIVADSSTGSGDSYDDDLNLYFVWESASDDESGIKEYNVSYFENDSCTGNPAGTILKVTENYTPFTGTNGKAYSFKIESVNNAEVSSVSTCSTPLQLAIFSMDPTPTTFTPALGKRQAPGPMDFGFSFQGHTTNSTTVDRLEVQTGNLIGKTFNEVYDNSQGTILLWVTPKWNGNDGLQHTLISIRTDHKVLEKTSNGLLQFYSGSNDTISVDASAWIAGESYLVVLRWDLKNPIDGTNYFSLSVNDSHFYSVDTITEPDNLQANLITIGNAAATSPQNIQNSSNAIISGLTIYRRVLFDGTYGVDLGNGDELALAYNGGAGKDIAQITGSWDAVFALPSNQQAGQITNSNFEAWSHPHSSNLIGGTNGKDGYMLDGNPINDNWLAEASPVSVTAIPNNEKIFSGGYRVITNASNQGIYHEIGTTSEWDFFIRVVAHGDGSGSFPRVILRDMVGLTNFVTFDGTTTSTRDAPDQIIIAAESPFNCNSIRMKLVNGASSGTVYFHQAEFFWNQFDNPSFESGVGDPFVPDGWLAHPDLNDPGESSQTADAHSGAWALKFTNMNGRLYDRYAEFYFPVYRYAMAGIWHKEGNSLNAGGFRTLDNQTIEVQNLRTSATPGARYLLKENPTTQWTYFKGVARRDISNGDQDFEFAAEGATTMEGKYDDIHSLLLDQVAVVAFTANKTESTELSGLRVDSLDTATQAINFIKNDVGSIKFNYTPTLSAANQLVLSQGTETYVGEWYGNSNNYIRLYWSAANTLTLQYSMAGTSASASWDATGSIVPMLSYLISIGYVANGSMILKIDDEVKIELPNIPSGFSTPLSAAYWGSSRTGEHQADAIIAPP